MELGYICGDEAERTTVQEKWEDIRLIRLCETLWNLNIIAQKSLVAILGEMEN